jgi:hypothetical protein
MKRIYDLFGLNEAKIHSPDEDHQVNTAIRTKDTRKSQQRTTARTVPHSTGSNNNTNDSDDGINSDDDDINNREGFKRGRKGNKLSPGSVFNIEIVSSIINELKINDERKRGYGKMSEADLAKEFQIKYHELRLINQLRVSLDNESVLNRLRINKIGRPPVITPNTLVFLLYIL